MGSFARRAAVAAALALIPFGAPAVTGGSAQTPPAFCEYGPSAGPGTPIGVKQTSPQDPATGYSRDYCLHVPTGLRPHQRVPLVMVLHGCYTDAPTVAYESQFNVLADKEKFITAYPQESAFAAHPENASHPYDGNGNGRGAGSGCWNWHLPDQWQRDSPEPTMLAAITTSVMQRYPVDARRVYITGVSGGGAMANLMAVTHPDLYAAVAIIAGCEYAGDACLGSTSALPPQASAELAYDASAAHARVVPYLIENGDVDPVVPVVNAMNLATQWQVFDHLAAGMSGAAAFAPQLPCAAKSQSVGPLGSPDTSDPLNNPNAKHGYDVLYYSLAGEACVPDHSLGELWIVHGELHVWPGGPERRLYPTEDTYYDIWTDPLGPPMTQIAYQFFMAHPMPPAHHGHEE